MTAPIFIVAGEASGDVLAGRLMRAVNYSYGQQQWVGLGGAHMVAEGLVSAGDMSRLSLIGLGAALKHYKDLSAFADELVDLALRTRPQLILTVDAKGFSIRFAARLKRRMRQLGWSAPIVHTVAPTVWAWGMWRRHKFANVFDGLLCLFPFEPQYFESVGLKSHFIGHPAAFAITAKKPTGGIKKRPPQAPKIAILPGSRRAEISYILPVMISAVSLIRQNFPGATFTLPTVRRLRESIEQLTACHNIDLVDGDQQLGAVLDECDVMMAASGTVTLEAALHGAPGVTCYKAGWLSAKLGQLIVDMDKVILPNAILDRAVYPFLFQNQLTGENLASAVTASLHDPQSKTIAYKNAQELRKLLVKDAKNFDALVVQALAGWLGPVS